MKPENNEFNDDSELLRRLVGGEEEAFAALYIKYNLQLYAFIFRFVHAPDLAEDLTQEVFIKIWEKRQNLSHVLSFKNYLFITARNHTLNCLKKAFRSEAAMGIVVNAFIKNRNVTEEEVLHKEYIAFLTRVLNDLPERSRQVFRLCREQGKTYDEVASDLGISRNTVKNHMMNSMKILSNSIKKEFGFSLTILLLFTSFNK